MLTVTHLLSKGDPSSLPLLWGSWLQNPCSSSSHLIHFRKTVQRALRERWGSGKVGSTALGCPQTCMTPSTGKEPPWACRLCEPLSLESCVCVTDCRPQGCSSLLEWWRGSSILAAKNIFLVLIYLMTVSLYFVTTFPQFPFSSLHSHSVLGFHKANGLFYVFVVLFPFRVNM